MSGRPLRIEIEGTPGSKIQGGTRKLGAKGFH